MADTPARSVLITGANRGIGLEFVRRLLAAGDQVVATARRPEAATELQALAAESGLRVLPLDVSDPDAIEALAGALPFDRLDLLINNAGVFGAREASLQDVDFAAVEETIRINTFGPLRITRALWDRLGEGAKVVHITSLVGSIADNGSGGRYAYRMSKAALNMAVRSLGYECATRGVTTFTIHPGWVRTDMGGPDAPLSVEESVAAMLRCIDQKTVADNGLFFDREGQPLPW